MTNMNIRTIPLALDGYTDLPPGKIANVVTYLERRPPGEARRRHRRSSQFATSQSRISPGIATSIAASARTGCGSPGR